jgi:sacsin
MFASVRQPDRSHVLFLPYASPIAFTRPYCAGLEGELRLVHPRLSAPVAEALGVASRRRLMLAASADCLALGLAGAGGAVEAFGQSEALTTRLRHIIQVGRCCSCEV